MALGVPVLVVVDGAVTLTWECILAVDESGVGGGRIAVSDGTVVGLGGSALLLEVEERVVCYEAGPVWVRHGHPVVHFGIVPP